MIGACVTLYSKEFNNQSNVPENFNSQSNLSETLDSQSNAAETPVSQPNVVPENYELGYWLNQRHEKHGFVHEACQRVMKYAIEHLNAGRFIIMTHTTNAKSRRVAERLGFRVSGEKEIELLDVRPEWGKFTLVVYEKIL